MLREATFYGVTGERAPSFRDVSLGETAAIPKGGMRRGQNSPGETSQKRAARSLGTTEKVASLSSPPLGQLMSPALEEGYE